MTIAWNQSLFVWLNHACAALPDWLWSSLTITAHTSVIFALFTPLLLNARGRQTISALFCASIVGGIVSVAIKESLQMARPASVLMADQFHLIGHRLDVVSFPSGHTLGAFATATLLVLGLQLRSWRLLAPMLLASLVALSRIAVGAHWPLDVLGGAVLGSLCGWAGWQLALLAHQRTWTQTKAYAYVQAATLLLASAGLFTIDTGYPAALVWQYMTAGFGVVFSIYFIYLQLKSVKSSLKG